MASARTAGRARMGEDEWVQMAIGSCTRASRDCGNRDAHCWLSRPWTSGLVGWATSTREFCGTREYAGGGLRGRPNASPQGHARPPARVEGTYANIPPEMCHSPSGTAIACGVEEQAPRKSSGGG